MHVDDVGANGHMGGEWNAKPVGAGGNADLGERRTAIREEPADRLPEPQARGHAVDDRLVQLCAGLFGHAERAWTERGVDVFRRRS